MILLKSYSWKQTGGTTTTKLSDDKSRRFSFVAPYIKGNTITTELSFELTADNTNGKPATYTANVIVKRIQRALVFQGGVALGAYEAGVFRALVEKITEENIKRGLNERPLFDIIAGTSIGAMNAQLLPVILLKKMDLGIKNLSTSLKDFGIIRPLRP